MTRALIIFKSNESSKRLGEGDKGLIIYKYKEMCL